MDETLLEHIVLDWFSQLGYAVQYGPDLAPEGRAQERDDFGQVVLLGRLRDAIARLNPTLPADALDEVVRIVTRPQAPSLVGANRAMHRLLVDGVAVQYRGREGHIQSAQVRLLDFDYPQRNDWLAVNQFTVVEAGADNIRHNRRADVVLFVNGLPLAVIELKNPADEHATIWTAFQQLQTYKREIPSLFHYNEALIISDGLQARLGSLTADRERFMPWRTIDGQELAPATLPQLEVLLRGVCQPAHFLDLLRHFIVFEERDGHVIKKMAAYHQFHAVREALRTTLEAARPDGDRRAGVIWHTQGAGKSLSMLFYAGKLILHPALHNPTIVVLTDRNDLDGQLFGTFARCRDILRQTPVQAQDRDHLRELLKVASGGVVFTTVQKFLPDAKGDPYPLLSDRHNIVVIADEAHRSQYEFIDGFARHMRDGLPNASFIGFTGTPIELSDRNTRAVFGDYISIYDIQRAVEDGFTVPIYYESRLARLELDPAERPHLDAEFDEVTEGEELAEKEKLKTKWAALEALVGAEKRLKLLARDLVQHWETRLEAMDGKAMIVCMSRRICVDLYRELVALRPQWHSEDDSQGVLKVVMTGSASDPDEWQGHVRNKARRDALAERFKDPTDPLKIVLVRDMWLTGFDAPSLHTMYVDKPMHAHGLMQAIARVNRVYKDKPGGLIVDYLGLAGELRKALATYTASGGKGLTAHEQAEAVAVMLEKYETCCGLFHGLDWSPWTRGTPAQRLSLMAAAQDHILGLEDGRARLNKAVTELSQAFALAPTHEEATRIRDDVAFFQAVRNALNKTDTNTDSSRSPEEMDYAIRQLVSKAVTPDGVVDVFDMAGLEKAAGLSILSEEFLAQVRGLPHKNLALEILHKLLNDEIKSRARKQLVQARSFAELLDRSIQAYNNRTRSAAEIIEELIALARDIRAANNRGEDLGLTEEELAFYDALGTNDSAVAVLGDDTLKTIAHELVESIRRNASIDWTLRESIRAKMRVAVKRTLRRYGYPPDKQEQATQTVLQQAELLCADWAA